MSILPTASSLTSSIQGTTNVQGPSTDKIEQTIENISTGGKDDSEKREAFASMVGQTFFGQMLKSMRSSAEIYDGPEYFSGGRAEEVFQSMLDQELGEHMASARGGEISETMYELWTMPRRS